MIERIRFTWQLLVLSSVLMISGLLLLSRVDTGVSFNAFIVTLAYFTFVNMLVYFVISTGAQKSSGEQMVRVLLGIGLKFLLYLLYLLGYWLVIKNLEIPFIIIFFVLYLIFTFFLAAHLFKLLKNK
ncbi:MAG TPA: hypothetical protein ENO05_05075 [Bacteroides sp.]|nr:hypothetical protein [Bacteroides sp.]